MITGLARSKLKQIDKKSAQIFLEISFLHSIKLNKCFVII